jgi:hypothetical protein
MPCDDNGLSGNNKSLFDITGIYVYYIVRLVKSYFVIIATYVLIGCSAAVECYGCAVFSTFNYGSHLMVGTVINQVFRSGPCHIYGLRYDLDNCAEQCCAIFYRIVGSILDRDTVCVSANILRGCAANGGAILTAAEGVFNGLTVSMTFYSNNRNVSCDAVCELANLGPFNIYVLLINGESLCCTACGKTIVCCINEGECDVVAACIYLIILRILEGNGIAVLSVTVAIRL